MSQVLQEGISCSVDDHQLIQVDLTWQKPAQSSWQKLLQNDTTIDVDLGVMYELESGEKGVLQPLGGYLGAELTHPWILLEGDQKDNESRQERLHIYKPHLITKLLIFALIYDGYKKDKSLELYATLQTKDSSHRLGLKCKPYNGHFLALGLLSRQKDELVLTAEYKQFEIHQDADAHYGFGFLWQSGTKD